MRHRRLSFLRRITGRIAQFMRAARARSRALLTVLIGATALAIYGLAVSALKPLTILFHWTDTHIEWARVQAEQRDEVLIVIAPFRYSQVPDGGEHRRAGEQIKSVFAQYASKLHIRVRIEYLPWALADADSLAQAEKVGAEKRATLVIWGDIGPLRNEIRVLNRLYGKQHVSWSMPGEATHRIDEYARTHAIDRSGYAEFANRDLTNGLAFLAHLAVADVLYFQQETGLVFALYLKAAGLIGERQEDFVAHGMAGVVERLTAIREVTQDAGTGIDQFLLLQTLASLGTAGSDPRYEIAAIDAQWHAGLIKDDDLQKKLRRIDEILDDLAVGSSTVVAVDARLLRATLLEYSGGTAEAAEERRRVTDLLEALARQQTDYGVIARLIKAHTLLGQFDAAHALIRSAMQNEDVGRSALWTWTFATLEVDAYLGQHQYGHAIDAAQRAIASSRTEDYRIAAMRTAVQAYMGAGDALAATTMLEKITQSPRGSSWDFNNLGVLHLVTKQCKEALTVYTAALERHDFLAAHTGQLQSWLCLHDIRAISEEKKKFAASRKQISERHLLTNDDAEARLFEVELDAAEAYYQHRKWRPRNLTEIERQGLVAFSLGAADADNNPRFISWVLYSLIDDGQADVSVREALVEVERSGTADRHSLGELAGVE